MGAATDIAAQVRTGRLLAVDVVTEALDRAEASQERLNAFTLIDRGGALARATGIDMLVTSGRDPGPLSGVPIALKDLIDQTGLPNTRGGSFAVDYSPHSATVVRRLGAAGAVIIGRTGLHEFAFGFTSENHWFGPGRNPWDLTTSPGGSSGGSAAAVAAGIAPIGIGTDTGGSVRVPAALCGVFGLKVTHGRVPLTGVYPLAASLDTVGPMAGNVEDLAAAYSVMAGDDPKDPWSQPVPVDPVPSDVDLSSLRFGVVTQWNNSPHTRSVASGMDTFLKEASRLGVSIVDIDEPELQPDAGVERAVGAEILTVHGARFAESPEGYGPATRARLANAAGGSAEDVLAAVAWRTRAQATMARLSDSGVDVLIAPTVGGMAKMIGEHEMDLDGEKVPHRSLLATFTAPINHIGVPSLSAPITGTGAPGVSVQLIGPIWGESKLLAIAGALETAGVFTAERPPNFLGE
jgi:Asp-tRNA(Asn)/Glu-tRNA(Gln) amidotransferase A subunit family amidase